MYSFDIFDTLITRNTASPYGIFLIMQKLLSKNGIKKEYLFDNFAKLRIKAEKNARQFNVSTEISLIDIYKELAQMFYLDDNELSILMDLEIRTEINCALGIDENIKKLINLIERNEHVVLISDMYLSEPTIRNILIKVNPIFNKIPIYISSEYYCKKQDGFLYIKVRNIENISYDHWTHFGDNYISDILIPSILGIKTSLVEQQSLFSWENELINKLSLESNLALQVALGLAKKIRRQHKLNTLQNIGISIGGFILFPYVEWIIQQSLQLKLKYLYFIARDGFILKKIADIYISINQLDLKTKYIYGSRKAWRVDDISKRRQVLQYLLQEVDFSNQQFAFVDLQGTGYSIEYLEKILGAYIKKSITVFYYDMSKPIQNPRCNFKVFNTNENCEIIETLCRAPHEATIGYTFVESQYIPQLEQKNISQMDIERLENYIYGVLLFAKEAASFAYNFGIRIEYGLIGEFLLKYCQTNPDSLVLNFVGEIPFDTDNLNENKKYAPKLTYSEIFQIFMWRTSENLGKYYNGTNLKLSILRMDLKERIFFNFCYKNRTKILGKLIHFYKRIVDTHKFETPGKRVIIYAAGTFGKEIYERLQCVPNIKIVGWADINHKKYKELGYQVESLNNVL